MNAINKKIKRPLLRYHGGKWMMAPWIIEHFPPHRIYVEPFGGGASVLLRKERSFSEVYNDLDNEIVNLFKIARDHGPELKRLLELTPFSRSEFELSYHMTDDLIEQARRTVVRSFMGFGSNAVLKKITGFRMDVVRRGSIPPHDWMNYPQALLAIIDRLRGVSIENRNAIKVMKDYDRPDTLHYCDPPYTAGSRGKGVDYRFEMSDKDHRELADAIHKLQGNVIISGYRSDLYDELYRCWKRVERQSYTNAAGYGAKRRIECIWIKNLHDLQTHFDY